MSRQEHLQINPHRISTTPHADGSVTIHTQNYNKKLTVILRQKRMLAAAVLHPGESLSVYAQ